MTLYRRIIVLEILADHGDVVNADLPDVVSEITEGGWSGAVLTDATTEVSPDAMRQLLISQGSDPEFLVSDEDYGPQIDVQAAIAAGEDEGA